MAFLGLRGRTPKQLAGFVTGTITNNAPPPAPTGIVVDLEYQFGDGSAIVAAGAMAQARVDFAATVTQSSLGADASGSAVVDIQTSAGGVTFASIAASAKPTLSSAQVAVDTTLTGWAVAIAAGTYVRAVVQSASTVKMLAGALKLTRA